MTNEHTDTHFNDSFDQLLDATLIARSSAQLPHNIEDRILDSMSAETTSVSQSSLSRIRYAFAAIAAALILAAGIGFVLRRPTTPHVARVVDTPAAPKPVMLSYRDATNSALLQPHEHAQQLHKRTTLSSAPVRQVVTETLPKLAIFPTPEPITPIEREVISAHIHASPDTTEKTAPKATSQPPILPDQLTIAQLHIEPLKSPDSDGHK